MNTTENKQKDFEQSEYMKKCLFQFHEDVLNPQLPEIKFTPEIESIYIRAYLSGAADGLSIASGILEGKPPLSQEPSPTLNRYAGTGIDNPNYKENLN